MKVKELIEELQKYDPEEEVYIWTASDGSELVVGIYRRTRKLHVG